MKKLRISMFAPLLAIFAGIFLSGLASTDVFAADGLDSISENCTFAYKSDKTTIDVNCKTISAIDTESNDNGDPGDVTFGAGTKTFTKKSATTYELAAKYSPTSLSGDSQTCTSKITLSDKAAEATISGDFITATARSTGEGGQAQLFYSCDLEGSSDITIRVKSSNDSKRRDNALKALLAAIKKDVNKVCPVVPPAANNKECVKNWNNAVKTCHNKVWTALDAVITTTDLVGTSPYGTLDNLTDEGKKYYRDHMIECLSEYKTPLGQPLFTTKQIKQVISAAAVTTMANGSASAEVDEEAETTEAVAEETTTCAVDGVGWIVCPVMKFLGNLNDAAFGFLDNLLTIRPALFTDPGTQKAWSSFRDLANIAFVAAFLVIVYSQVTGVGVTNYGIKKLLPRIFVAAVLVNISFWLCALAVDASNIVGSSAYSLLKDAIQVSTDAGGGGAGSETWNNVMGVVLGGAAIVLLLVVILLAPTVLLAAAVVLLILVARQALVIMLIVVAPLAFVAYLLPNTEEWFKKWRKAFMATLMVYPIVGVIFGASTLTSNILMSVSQDGPGGGDDEQMLKIVALGVLGIPLFAVPVVLKGSLSAAGAVGARLSGLSDRSNRMAAKRLKERGERYRNRINAANVARASDVIGGSGGALGIANSRRRRVAGAVVGLGSTRRVNNEQKDKYAKVYADAEARSYVADRASSDVGYAKRIAGGDEKLAGFVQSYALQKKEDEFEKDVKAAQVMERDVRRSKEELHARVRDKSLRKYERVAALRQFKDVANAMETQKMVETIAELGDAADAGTEDAETVQKIQRQFAESYAGSPLMPASVSGTDRGFMQRGEFRKKRNDRIKRDLEGDAKGSKVGSDYILKMDVDEMYEWATDPSAITTLGSLDPAAKQRFISAIEEAANDDIKGNQFEARQIEQLKKIAGHLGGSVTVSNPKYAAKWT